jgi:hypothetical protein
MKLAVILLMLLQSYAFAGPVCGNHATTAESMACCEKGHNDDPGPTIGDSHSGKCCASCDMGKGSAIKRQENYSAKISVAHLAYEGPLPQIENVELRYISPAFADSKHEYPPGSSEIFLLDRSLLI